MNTKDYLKLADEAATYEGNQGSYEEDVLISRLEQAVRELVASRKYWMDHSLTDEDIKAALKQERDEAWAELEMLKNEIDQKSADAHSNRDKE